MGLEPRDGLCLPSRAPGQPMLSLRSITKRFGSLTALDGVSLEVRPGEFLGLLGPNGAGKSTLMSLVSGLRRPDSGEIRVGGRPIGEGDARAALGLVPQNVALYLELSAEQNLAFFGELAGLRGAQLRSRVDAALEGVGLADRRGDLVSRFSGGMQRRLNIAAALLHQPRLLLCDEPTVGVDPQSRNAIFETLQGLNREGLTIVYSTHYMEEATRLCPRIAVIDHGRILADGPLDALLATLPFEEEIRFPVTEGTTALLAALEGGGAQGGAGALGADEAGGGAAGGVARGAGPVQAVDGTYRYRPRTGHRMSEFYAAAEGLGLPARLFTVQRPTLEALFLHLTGRNLRE